MHWPQGPKTVEVACRSARRAAAPAFRYCMRWFARCAGRGHRVYASSIYGMVTALVLLRHTQDGQRSQNREYVSLDHSIFDPVGTQCNENDVRGWHQEISNKAGKIIDQALSVKEITGRPVILAACDYTIVADGEVAVPLRASTSRR